MTAGAPTAGATRTRWRHGAAAGALAVMAIAAGCGSERSVGTTAPQTPTTAGDATAAPPESSDAVSITVTDAWARTSSAVAENGAVYMTLRASADSALTGATVARTVAVRTELHHGVGGADEAAAAASESGTGVRSLRGRGSHDGVDHDDGDPTTMEAVDSLALPAGTDVVLGPGGDHVMLIELATPLVAGRQFDLTLAFRGADDVTVSVTVSDQGP